MNKKILKNRYKKIIFKKNYIKQTKMTKIKGKNNDKKNFEKSLRKNEQNDNKMQKHAKNEINEKGEKIMCKKLKKNRLKKKTKMFLTKF